SMAGVVLRDIWTPAATNTVSCDTAAEVLPPSILGDRKRPIRRASTTTALSPAGLKTAPPLSTALSARRKPALFGLPPRFLISSPTLVRGGENDERSAGGRRFAGGGTSPGRGSRATVDPGAADEGGIKMFVNVQRRNSCGAGFCTTAFALATLCL